MLIINHAARIIMTICTTICTAAALLSCAVDPQTMQNEKNKAGADQTGVPQDHSGGKEPVDHGQKVPALEVLLKLSPLQQGHFMADLVVSERAFKPESGVGAWSSAGLTWKDSDKIPEYTNETTLSLEFQAPGSDKQECRLNNEAWTPCANSWQGTNLGEGWHELQVRTTPSQVVIGAVRWKIDRTAPVPFLVREGNLWAVHANEDLTEALCRNGNQEFDCRTAFALTMGTRIQATVKDKAGNSRQVELAL